MERMPSPTLPDILRLTLERIEDGMEITPDDPTLYRLKQSILRALADLEIMKAEAA